MKTFTKIMHLMTDLIIFLAEFKPFLDINLVIFPSFSTLKFMYSKLYSDVRS
jgi:hypothetical protein